MGKLANNFTEVYSKDKWAGENPVFSNPGGADIRPRWMSATSYSFLAELVVAEGI